MAAVSSSGAKSGGVALFGRRWLSGVRAAKSIGGVALFGRGWFSTAGDVGVFWDLDKCGLQEPLYPYCSSEEVDPFCIAPNIVRTLRVSGFLGRICIHAYGNTSCFSQHHFLQALLATGVDLHHVSGGRNEFNNHLLLELLLWAKENAPPAHMLLISGENSLSSVIHKLWMRGFGILLAYPKESIPSDLLGAAEKVWAWESMMKGFTRPCVSGSAPLLGSSKITSRGFTKPQVLSAQDTQLEMGAKSISWCPDAMNKPKKIPEKVIQQVLDIIRLRPRGFTLGAFRRQLGRSNVVLDKDFYGHKDLFTFLLAVPKLKASIVWTTDRTRTYLFTEDCTAKCTGDMRDDGKGSVDGDNNVSSKEEPRKKKWKKNDQHSSLENSQHLEMRPATSMEYGKECIITKVAGGWRRALSKLRQIVGFKSAAMAIAPLTRQSDKKNSQDKGHGGHSAKGEAQTIGKDVTPFPSQEEERLEMNEQSSLVAKDKEAASGCLRSHGEECFVEQNREIENLQGQKRQQSWLNLRLQAELCGPSIENRLSRLMSREREHDFIRELLKSTCLTEQLCKDITCRLFSEGQRFELTRATSMDELVKLWTKSLQFCGATLTQVEVKHLAEGMRRVLNEDVETKLFLGLHDKEPMPPAQQSLNAARDLIDIVMEFKHGLFMSCIKREFLSRYGYELDNKSLGHDTLSSLIRSLKELTIIKGENNELVVLFHADETLEQRRWSMERRRQSNVLAAFQHK